MEPRELALREVRESPWLQQRELAARLSEETGLAESTLIRLFRRMEAEGELQSGLDGRRKTYALPEPEPEGAPTPGALWSSRLAPLGEPEPEPETGRRAGARAAPGRGRARAGPSAAAARLHPARLALRGGGGRGGGLRGDRRDRPLAV